MTNETTGTDVTKPASRTEEKRALRAQSPARAAAAELASSGALDELFARIDAGELDLTGDGRFIPGAD